MTINFVDLNRSFLLIPKDHKFNENDYDLSFSFGLLEAKKWNDILDLRRVIILAEAGAGKTEEIKAVTKRLRDDGKKTFFLRLEILSSDFESSFEIGTMSEFNEWIVSDVPSWFFLDSVDEARLRGPKEFEVAIRNLDVKLCPNYQIMMADLVKWLNRKQEIHPVLISGISQFQFVHIHPFLDGNGRVSRLLSTFCLYRAGYDFKRLFTISEYYDRNRPAFYRAIQIVRENGMDLTGWLEYFVEGLTTQLAEVRKRGELAIRRDLLIREHKLSERQAKALGHILEYGSLNI